MSSRYAFEPSDDVGNRILRRCRYKAMDMIQFSDFRFNYRKSFFIADLTQQFIKPF